MIEIKRVDLVRRLARGVDTYSSEDLSELACRWGISFPSTYRVALEGTLGAGKTTFVKGLARSWGIGNVTSPTFNILNLYRGNRTLLHVDAYRVEDFRVLNNLCLEELCVVPFCLVVEWPERCFDLPYDAHVALSVVGENVRRVQVRIV